MVFYLLGLKKMKEITSPWKKKTQENVIEEVRKDGISVYHENYFHFLKKKEKKRTHINTHAYNLIMVFFNLSRNWKQEMMLLMEKEFQESHRRKSRVMVWNWM